MRDPDEAHDSEVCDGMGGAAARRRDRQSERRTMTPEELWALRAERARKREIALTVEEPVYSVWRGEGDGRQLVHRTAAELTHPEILALPEPQRRIALRSIRCTLERDGDGWAVVSL